MKLKFGSVCSGIEAASVAWEPLGWRASWFAEIEAFPSAVLAYRFPSTLNLGDMTKIAEMVSMGFVDDPDVLVGGTPCQAFSVAGSRQSLDDERGQLSLSFITLANTIDEQRIENGKDECIVVWENVPGVLSTKDNAFGCFLGELSGTGCELQPSGKKWTNSGCVFGPQRAVAWRVLDAQYFGVAQRRRRVFVVASARKGFNPTKVLFESESLRRDTPPSRRAGEETTGGVGASPYIASGKPAVGTLMANAGTKLWLGNQEAFSGDYAIIHPKVVHGTQDPITQDNQAFPIGRNNGQENAVAYPFDSLASNSMKSSNPISGCREVDLAKTIDTTVSCPSKNQGGIGILQSKCFGIPGNWIGCKPENGGNAVEPMVDIAPCQTKTDRHAVAFGIQGSMIGRSETAGPQGSGVSDDISFTLTKGDRHGVAYSLIGDVTPKFGEELCMTLRAQGGGGIVPPSVKPPIGLVRRLTPVECERLQGFPDNWTQIPYRNKAADLCPDGPRYAACGNSMAVPVMRWIAQRIEKHLNEISHLNN